MLKTFSVIGGVCKSCAVAAQNSCLLMALSTAKFLGAGIAVQNPGVYAQPPRNFAQFVPIENLAKLHLPGLTFPQFTQPLLKLLRSI